MKVVIKYGNSSKALVLEADPDELLCDVLNRREVREATGGQPASFRCFNGKQTAVFDQSRTLRSQGIADGDVLVLVRTVIDQVERVVMHDTRNSSMKSGEIGFVSPAGGGVVPHQQSVPPWRPRPKG